MSEFIVPVYFNTLRVGQEFQMLDESQIHTVMTDGIALCGNIPYAVSPQTLVFIKELVNQSQGCLSKRIVYDHDFHHAVSVVSAILRGYGTTSVEIDNFGGYLLKD
jgi:hypothetical protein